jgi:hypothetical protein
LRLLSFNQYLFPFIALALLTQTRFHQTAQLCEAFPHVAPLCIPLRYSTKHNSMGMFDGTSLRRSGFGSAEKRLSRGVHWSILHPAHTETAAVFAMPGSALILCPWLHDRVFHPPMSIVHQELIVFSGPSEGHTFPNQKGHSGIESPGHAEQVYGPCNCQFMVVIWSHTEVTEDKEESQMAVEGDPDSISYNDYKAGEWPILTR